jgi:hypothetical protein
MKLDVVVMLMKSVIAITEIYRIDGFAEQRKDTRKLLLDLDIEINF